MTSKKVSDIRRMKISKTDRKDKKNMPIKIKPAKISKQKFLNALLYGRKRMQVKSITPKNLGTVIQFT